MIPSDVWVVSYFDIRQHVWLMSRHNDTDGVSGTCQLQQPDVKATRQRLDAETSMNDHVMSGVQQGPWPIGRCCLPSSCLDDGRRHLG